MAAVGAACVAGETTTAANYTHPTGMHSCNFLCVNLFLFTRSEREEEYSYGRYAAQIDPEVLERHEVDRKCVDIECAPGDVVFFSHILFHRGGHNNSGKPYFLN